MSKDRHAFLGMPGYGKQTAQAGRAFWNASREGVLQRVRPDLTEAEWALAYQQGSLLASNFNRLWCHALNKVHRGGRVDYFAMLHDDIGAPDWWLDTLIDELEARDLDVLGVVVPIKDINGLTSIALEHPDRNPWRPLCRLTMHEIFQLPETFTSEDVGHPILLNTGCWVCRFDPEWARKVHFTINDRIVFDTVNNVYRPEVEPEDWFFGRLCHELGLKIGATRKVHVSHRGEVDFHNTHAWGAKQYDDHWVSESVVNQVDADGWRFPMDVDGWLTREEGKGLAELARGKRVLEIGSYCGKSTICMAQTAESVVSVDPHDGRGTPSPKDTAREFVENLKKYGVREKVTPYKGVLAKDGWENHPKAFDPDSPLFISGPFDLVFIDGSHDYESVRSDIFRGWNLLADGGLLALHDYRTEPGEHDGRWDEGVTQAVEEFVSQGAEIVSRHGTVAVVRPPALVEA